MTFKLVVIRVAKGKTKFVPKQITHAFEMTEELTIHDIKDLLSHFSAMPEFQPVLTRFLL